MSKTVPIFSLAYTSARPGTIATVVDMWNQRSRFKDHEWAICVDEGDEEAWAAAAKAVAKSAQDKQCRQGEAVVNKGPKNSTSGWNCAAAATTGKVIICVADDFKPPVDWDVRLLELEPEDWVDKEHVVKTDDGYVRDIFVLSILTRKRYERFGYVFYPRYPSLFSDTEFGEVAKRDGVVIEANHLLFEHLHPDCGKRARDQGDLTHASKERWKAGEMLFNVRKARNFPLDDGPKAVKDVPVTRKENKHYVAYLQVTKDDLCLLEVCERLQEEGVKDFCFCQPDCYWSGEPLEEGDAESVLKVIEALKAKNAVVHHRMFHVEQFHLPGDSRIDVETRVRNETLTWMRELGYQHILVVDGDELWVRGTLKILQSYVEQGHKVISCKLIPIIGFPGYPVDLAQDLAVVYVGEGVQFKTCRSPFIKQTVIPRPLVYHFTGTRRTLDETIKKHRRGGHYDDPEYDFEGWIKETLPKIRPGLTNVHMFRSYQIWPVVRSWRPGELESMPATVRPFLGTESL